MCPQPHTAEGPSLAWRDQHHPAGGRRRRSAFCADKE